MPQILTDDDIKQLDSKSNQQKSPKQTSLTDDDITTIDKRGASGGDSPTLSLAGVASGVAKGASDTLEGIGSGVFSTAEGIYNLGRKGAKAVGLGDIPEAWDWLHKAAAPVQYTKDAQGKEVPTEKPSTSFKVGRTGEQIGEFFIPGGTAGRVAKVAEAAAGTGKVAKAVGMGTRAVGEGLAAGGVTLAQTGGDVDQAKRAAVTAGLMTGAFSTVGQVLKAVPVKRSIARFGYKDLKGFPKDVYNADVDDITSKALDEQIYINRHGLAKSENLQAAKKGAVDTLLNNTPGNVDWQTVEAPIRRLRQVAFDLGKNEEVASIDKYLHDFATAKGFTPPTPAVPPGQVPTGILGPNGTQIMRATPGSPMVPGTPPEMNLVEANEAKRQLQSFATNIFGRDGTSISDKQLDALMSTGIKRAIEEVVPEVKAMNRDTQLQAYITEAIDKALKGGGHIMSRGEMIMLFMLPKAGLAYVGLQIPAIRSAVAIASQRFAANAASRGANVGRILASQDPLGPVPKR